MSILVAAPTAESKDYALDAYVDAYKRMRYGGKFLFMVDTTPHLGYQPRLRELGIQNTHIGWETTPYNDSHLMLNIDRAWAVIINHAYAMGVEWILSLESDIIAPPETLQRLLSFASTYDAWVVAHSYPKRETGSFLMSALGCTLFRRDIFPPSCTLADIKKNHSMESSVYNIPREQGHVVIVIDNLLSIQHLDNGEG